MENRQNVYQQNGMQNEESKTTTKDLGRKTLRNEKFMREIRNMYLNGIPVTMIAKTMGTSRWWIYVLLKESGVNTSIGRRGKKRSDNLVDIYLNEKWPDSEIGRKPKKIAEELGVPVTMVNTCLKNRDNSLISSAYRLPIADVLTGMKEVSFKTDPYKLSVTYSGKTENGEDKEITLSEKEINEALLKIQSGS